MPENGCGNAADVCDNAENVGGNAENNGGGSAYPMRMMSAKTPAAVTSAPAP